jgi:hypothetical protein
MSAINALVQRNAVHMMTDSLLYVKGKVLQTNFPKCLPIRGMRAAVASTGPASFAYLLAEMLAKCETFDEVVAKDREWWRGAFDWYVENERNGASEYATVVLIGWLEHENRPAAFAIEISNGGERAEWVRSNSAYSDPTTVAHDLVELPILANPTPPVEDLVAAGWPIGVAPDDRDAEADLLHMLEIQRRRPASDGLHYIGGHAVMTSVDVNGVSQRVVHSWPDKAGKRVRPRGDARRRMAAGEAA